MSMMKRKFPSLYVGNMNLFCRCDLDLLLAMISDLTISEIKIFYRVKKFRYGNMFKGDRLKNQHSLKNITTCIC